MTTLEQTLAIVEVVARTRLWSGDHRRIDPFLRDMERISRQPTHGIDVGAATCPVRRFMLRAAVSVRHLDGVPPLNLLARYRLTSATAYPIEVALKDMVRIIRGDDGDRLLSRLKHQAGDGGCDLLDLGRLIHCVSEGDVYERPEGAGEYLMARAGAAQTLRARLLEDLS